MTDIYAVYGSGGYAREVMPLLQNNAYMTTQTSDDDYVFIDDFPDGDTIVNGRRVLTFKELIENKGAKKVYCCIAIASKDSRQKITERCVESGIELITVRAMNSVIMDDVTIGKGSILSPFVTLTSNIKIGKSFHANIYSYVGHDCAIGDYVTFAPSVKCNGNVHIEDGVYVGTGAIILPGTNKSPIIIGKNSKI